MTNKFSHMANNYFLTKNQVVTLFSDGPLNSWASRLVFAAGLVAMAVFLAGGVFGGIKYNMNEIMLFVAVDMFIMIFCPYLLQKKKKSP